MGLLYIYATCLNYVFGSATFLFWLRISGGVRSEMTLVKVVMRGRSTIRGLGYILRRCNECVINEVNVPCERGGVGVVDVTISTPRSVVDTVSNGVKGLSNMDTGATCSGIMARV